MKSVIVERPEGQAYTSFGGAVLPVDLESGHITGSPVELHAAHAGDDKAAAVAESIRRTAGNIAPVAPAQAPIRTGSAPQPQTKLGKRGAMKVIRDRIREIKALLKDHAALKRELDELERVVALSKKPLAAVRNIRTG